MKNLTAFIVLLTLMLILGVSIYYLWDIFSQWIVYPLRDLPVLNATAIAIFSISFLVVINLWRQAIRKRIQTPLMTAKLTLYQTLLRFLVYGKERREVDYHDLKAQMILLADRNVMNLFSEWEQDIYNDLDAERSQERLIIAIRKDLALPNQRLSNQYFSDFLLHHHPSRNQ